MAKERGFSTSGAADQCDDLSGSNLQIQVLVNDVIPELRPYLYGFTNDLIRIANRRVHTPMLLVRMANSASIRMTAVIAATTELVVLVLRLSVFGFTRNPK